MKADYNPLKTCDQDAADFFLRSFLPPRMDAKQRSLAKFNFLETLELAKIEWIYERPVRKTSANSGA